MDVGLRAIIPYSNLHVVKVYHTLTNEPMTFDLLHNITNQISNSDRNIPISYSGTV
jgi:hypothetical protein